MGLLGHVAALLQAPGLLLALPLFAIGALVERLAPAERGQPLADVGLNIAYAVFGSWLYNLTNPILAGVGIALVNACGGGLIRLPDGGWTIIGSAALFIVAMDFMEYLFHRAQHAVPFLWAMHSLHHSDPSVNVTTATRAFWLEPGIKAVFVYPVVGLLFQVTPAIYAVYGFSKLYDFVNHLNLKVHFGKFWVVINGPQYHRLHHSRRPEHFNRNFAAFFPVWDWIFGTYHRPMPEEFPVTGLDTRDAPRNFLEAVIWPLRRMLPARRTA